eukprot:UN01449
MKSIINLLFALSLVMMASAAGLRDAGDHGRNAAGFFIGFGVGLVIVFLGVCCWRYFETFDLCQRSQKEKQYSPPPETGKSAD